VARAGARSSAGVLSHHPGVFVFEDVAMVHEGMFVGRRSEDRPRIAKCLRGLPFVELM
jgi:hypothetical protein